MNRLLSALLCMTLGMTLIPFGDAIAKQLSNISTLTPGFMAWTRFAFGSAAALPLVIYTRGFSQLQPGFIRKQCVRGFSISLTLVFTISAVSKTPLAEVFGAFFIGPVIATILSVVWLKERVGWHKVYPYLLRGLKIDCPNQD